MLDNGTTTGGVSRIVPVYERRGVFREGTSHYLCLLQSCSIGINTLVIQNLETYCTSNIRFASGHAELLTGRIEIRHGILLDKLGQIGVCEFREER
jgi:hypothetical protein